MATITCPECGAKNDWYAMNCKQCQTHLKFALDHPEEIEAIEQHDQGFPSAPVVQSASLPVVQSASLPVTITAGIIGLITGLLGAVICLMLFAGPSNPGDFGIFLVIFGMVGIAVSAATSAVVAQISRWLSRAITIEVIARGILIGTLTAYGCFAFTIISLSVFVPQ